MNADAHPNSISPRPDTDANAEDAGVSSVPSSSRVPRPEFRACPERSRRVPSSEFRVPRSAIRDPRSLPPFVSVIIPVLGEAGALRLCLEALDRQSFPPEAFEVLVVDNGPSGEVRDCVAAFPRAAYLVEPTRSSYAARNRGLASARGNVLAFTDADCLPQADWIEKGAAALLREADAGLIAGRIDVFAAEPARPTAVELFEIITAFPQAAFVEKWHFGATANVFTRTDTFAKVGLFNPRLQSGGDLEWGQRVHRQGHRVAYADEVRIAHPARRTLRELRGKTVRITRGILDTQDGERSLSRLLRDLRSDWPRPRDVWQVCRDPRASSAGDRLRLAAIAMYVKGVRSRIRIGEFFKRKP